MNFDLSEEQTLLRNLVERFAASRYDATRRLRYVREERGYCAQGWAELAETGLLAFPFAEEHGGFGGGVVELITVMEAIGRAVAVEPLLPVIVMAGQAIERAGTAEQQAHWLPRLTSGEAMAALAHFEPDARFNQDAVATRAHRKDDAATLDGRKQMVPGGAFADLFVVSARDDDGATGLYLVPRDAPGLSVRSYRMIDGSLAADIALRGVPAEPMAAGGDVLGPLFVDVRLAIAAELLGLTAMMFDATLDYVRTRKQFGQAIGTFQAIQHRMADNYARLELSRSQLYRAAATNGADRDRAVTGAKAYIAAAAVALGEDAIQLHGGIGITEELLVGQAFKRVMLLASLLGDSDWELRRYAALFSAA